jgi:hypothetical protein
MGLMLIVGMKCIFKEVEVTHYIYKITTSYLFIIRFAVCISLCEEVVISEFPKGNAA